MEYWQYAILVVLVVLLITQLVNLCEHRRCCTRHVDEEQITPSGIQIYTVESGYYLIVNSERGRRGANNDVPSTLPPLYGAPPSYNEVCPNF